MHRALTSEGSTLTAIIVEPHRSFEPIDRRFKQQCEKSALPSERRTRHHHQEPGAKRTRTAPAARQKAEKRQRMSD
jgi:ribosomal protein S21